MFGWVRRNIFVRVSLVVILAGLCALAVGTLSAVRLVAEDKEASLVEGVVTLATERAVDIRHRVTLSRSELRAVVLAVAVDRLLEVPRLAESSATAVVASREGEEVLEVSTNEAALANLRAAAVPPSDGVTRLDDAVVVMERSGDVEARAIVDLGAFLEAPSGWTVELIDAEQAPRAAFGVLGRRYVADGAERASAVASTAGGLAVRVDAPLAPAREAAFAISRRMVFWSSISLLPLVVLAWLLSRAVTRPIATLAAVVRDHRADDELTLPALPPDEIGELAVAIKAMIDRLRNDLRALRAAARFTRQAAVGLPEELLDQLRVALSDAGGAWEVRATPLADLERELAEQGVGRVTEVIASDPEGAEVMIQFDDGTFVFPLAHGADDHGCVVGRAAPQERDVRMAELLARITVERLRNLELTRQALVNEKLTALGTLSAGVAHEMNTPLAYLLANLHALERETEGETLAMVEDARLGAERLTRIVRDISAISKGGDAIVTEDVELSGLAERVARVCRSRAGGAAVVVAAEGPVHASCDRGRIEQVTLNLVNNALDALGGREDAEIKIVIERTADGVSLEVRDNGPGIPAAARRKLFDAFFTTKGRQGTGLGLYLSRTFIEAHGGSLELASTGSEGTTFRVMLPNAPASAHKAPQPRKAEISSLPPAPPHREQPRVLIVDDEPALVRAMKRWLGKKAEVSGTTDATLALELIAGGAVFELILCDLDMPKMGGAAFVHALRESWPEQAKCVVIVTGSVGDAPEGLPVVRKPLTPQRLSELLAAL